MSQPFFSIIVPVYNSSKYINKCLNSIINQTFTDYEVIIIDDNSTDNTLHIVKKITTNLSNFKIIKLGKNKGVANARNQGIAKAKGKYVCFLDDDDMWLQNKLEVEHNYIVKRKLNWVFSNYEVLNENYKHLGVRFRLPGVYDFNKILNNGNPIGMLTVAIKSSIIKKYKFLNVGHEDYDLWLRISKKGYKGFLIKEVLAQYLKRSNSTSSNKYRSIKWTFQCYRRNGCSKIKSIFLIVKYAMNTVSRRRK